MPAAAETIAIFKAAIAAGAINVGKGHVRRFEAGRVEVADVIAYGLETIRIGRKAAKPDIDGAEHFSRPP